MKKLNTAISTAKLTLSETIANFIREERMNIKKAKSIFTLALALTLALGTSTFAAEADPAFTDVPSNAWYSEAVACCNENGLMVGTSDAAFSPNTELSRAMVVTILHRAAGTPAVTANSSFTDVESGTWYSDAVAWSEQNGVVSGYGNGLFGTNDPVTREQLITLLWRYNGSKPASAPTYTDVGIASSWATDAIAWADSNKIANTSAVNRLQPKRNATRAEAAYMLKQMLSPSGSLTTPPAFDLTTGTVKLNNGVEMPVLGLGTYRLTAEETETSVIAALKSGYKLIDTAFAYGNEESVGAGIAKSGVAREDVFIATKLWPNDYSNAAQAIDNALEKLGVEYIDLLFLHQPWQDYIAAYKAMEDAVAAGKVRAIGLSNFYQSSFDAIIGIAKITPAVLQSERNPYFQQDEMMAHIAPYGTVMMDWFPLGGRGDNIVPSERQQSLFDNEVILEIAKAHNKTAPQVILRWHVQTGGIAIPGSRNPDHILENITIFDFELTDEELMRLAALETDIPSFDFRETTEQPNFESFVPPSNDN
jgi:diketogulonate reductase-like aldo/keto reductase